MSQQLRNGEQIAEAGALCVQTVETLDELSGWYRDANDDGLGGDETILYAEDEAFVREVTCEILRSAGYRVLAARNAIEATEAFEENCDRIDLLLTDVVLPGETGRTLAARLRGKNPGLKALLVSGYAEQMGRGQEEREECLAKPFSSAVLLRRVRQILNQGQVRIGARM